MLETYNMEIPKKYLRKLMCHFLFFALTVCTYIDKTANLNHN